MYCIKVYNYPGEETFVAQVGNESIFDDKNLIKLIEKILKNGIPTMIVFDTLAIQKLLDKQKKNEHCRSR